MRSHQKPEEPPPIAMKEMKLTAISLHAWLHEKKLCNVFPLKTGSIILVIFHLVRAVFEFFEANGAINFIIKQPEPMFLPESLVFVAGLLDFAATIAGLATLLKKDALSALSLPVLLFGRFILMFVFLLYVSVYQIMPFGLGWGFVIGFVLLMIDGNIAYASSDIFLLILLRNAMDLTVVDVLLTAQTFALFYGEEEVTRNDLVHALLHHVHSLRMLQVGGVDPALMAWTFAESSVPHCPIGHKIARKRLLMGHEAMKLIEAGMKVQQELSEQHLWSGHLVAALSVDGAIEMDASPAFRQRNYGQRRFSVNSRAIREELERMAIHEKSKVSVAVQEYPPPAKVFACLPVEPTILVYAVFQVLVASVSLVSLVFCGNGIAGFFGFRTPREVHILEGVSHLMAAGCSALALRGIVLHRRAHRRVFEVGHLYGVGFGETFASFDPNSEVAQNVLQMLKLATRFMGIFSLWCIVQIFWTNPVVAMYFVVADWCGTYNAGLNFVSETSVGQAQRSFPVHCNNYKRSLFVIVLVYVALTVYMCWAVIMLWHTYRCAWKATECGFYRYLDEVRENIIRFLVGDLERRQVNESTPLL